MVGSFLQASLMMMAFTAVNVMYFEPLEAPSVCLVGLAQLFIAAVLSNNVGWEYDFASCCMLIALTVITYLGLCVAVVHHF